MPVVEMPINADRARREEGKGTRALIASHLTDELVVVIVAVPAGHRFDVAAVLLIKLIDEHDRPFDAVKLGEPARDPLVPAGDKEEARILLQGPFPLLSDVKSVS